MVAQDARKALEDENKLLTELERMASGNTAGARWSSYFSGWRNCNDDLLGKSDADFDRGVNDEVSRLKRMRDALAGDNSTAANFYRDAFSDDIQSTEDLR
ncbi:MAG: hypothetical protein WBQ64_14005 [Terriglobales bacterium]|jgi:hypothetical protein